MSGVVFVDTETTGLDPDRHEIWEVALIDAGGEEHVWQLPVGRLGEADSYALKISGFYERYTLHWDASWEAEEILKRFVGGFIRFTMDAHLAGAVVSFDEERLRRLIRGHGGCPMWHYHLIDVEALAVGWLYGYRDGFGDASEKDGPVDPAAALPWESEELSRAVGVNPDEFDRHTALGDARWAKTVYEAVTGG